MDFWFGLPEHFKRSVVNELDYKSRCRLRKCSKSHQSLVDSVPVFIEYVLMRPRPNQQLHLAIGEHNQFYDFLCDKNCDMDLAIHDFLLIFQNPKSKLKKLTIENHTFREFPESINDLITALLSAIELKNPSNLKIEELCISNFTILEENNFIKLIKILDSATFKSIYLQHFPVQNVNLFKELVESEQWKSLKKIEIVYGTNIPLGWFLRAESFSVKFVNLSGRDAWRCIQKYLSSPLPLLSSFVVFTRDELPLADILSHFEIPAKNEPLETMGNNNFYKHTQRFELPWSKEYLFVVKIAARMIKGVICRKTNLFNDFDTNDDL